MARKRPAGLLAGAAQRAAKQSRIDVGNDQRINQDNNNTPTVAVAVPQHSKDLQTITSDLDDGVQQQLIVDLVFQRQLVLSAAYVARCSSTQNNVTSASIARGSTPNSDTVDEQSYLNGCIHESDRILRLADNTVGDKSNTTLPSSFYVVYATALIRHALRLVVASHASDTLLADPAVILPNLSDFIPALNINTANDALHTLFFAADLASRAVHTKNTTNTGVECVEAPVIWRCAQILALIISTVTNVSNTTSNNITLEKGEYLFPELIKSIASLPNTYVSLLGTHKPMLACQVTSFIIQSPKICDENDAFQILCTDSLGIPIDGIARNSSIEHDPLLKLAVETLRSTNSLNTDLSSYISEKVLVEGAFNQEPDGKKIDSNLLITQSKVQITMSRAQCFFSFCDFVWVLDDEDHEQTHDDDDEEDDDNDESNDKDEISMDDETIDFLHLLYTIIVADMKDWKIYVSHAMQSDFKATYDLFDSQKDGKDVINNNAELCSKFANAVTNADSGIDRLIESRTLLAEALIGLGNLAKDDDEESQYYNQAVKILKLLEGIDKILAGKPRRILPTHFVNILAEWELD